MNKIYFLLVLLVSLLSCKQPSEEVPADPWTTIKENTTVSIILEDEWSAARRLNISNSGWEDGLYISRNGLHLYATYIPADFLSFVLAGGTPEELPQYARGPEFDMDFTANPTGLEYLWYQSDIIYSSRSSENEDFSPWTTSGLKRSMYSEGAFNAVFTPSGTIDMLIFTSNEEYTAQNNFKILRDTDPNPTGTGSFITATDTNTEGTSSINTNFIEDNPHLEHLGGDEWVLFFDSEDRPGGLGGHDIWYAFSHDNGTTWTTPQNLSSINSPGKEHQPHLYKEGSDWYLYFSKPAPDGKLGIYRSIMETPDDWDSWGAAEAVILAGNSAGIGEPSLTQSGDLYFTVIVENPDGNTTDRYDADPWMAEHRN